jgi:two-component system sensor histidine kinase BarA
LALAEELARRAVLSIENGQLYHETQEASENLRQAILILGEQQQQLRTLQQLTNLLNQRLTDLPGLLREMVQLCGTSDSRCPVLLYYAQQPSMQWASLDGDGGDWTEKLRLEDAFSPEGGIALSGIFDWRISVNSGQAIATPHTRGVPAAIYAVAIESVQAGRLGVLAIGNWEDRMLLMRKTGIC